MNDTLKEIERRLKTGETPESIWASMYIHPDTIYKTFKLVKPPKTFQKAVGFELFEEQPVPITSKPGWKILRS